MNDDYDPIQINADAVKFAESKFGKHYLKRLEAARERYLKEAMNGELTDSYRAHAATKAATVELEINYFRIAQTIQEDAGLLKRMSDNFKRRIAKKQEEVI